MSNENRTSPTASPSRPTPRTVVPAGETPARCPHCERPFRSSRQRDLHVGERHPAHTAEERAAYEAAREAEANDLFVFHLKVIAAITMLYAGFIVLYMVTLAVRS